MGILRYYAGIASINASRRENNNIETRVIDTN